MMKIQRITQFSLPTAILFSLLALLLWMPDLFLHESVPTVCTLIPSLSVSFTLGSHLLTVLTLLAVVLNAVLLSMLVYHLNISRTHSFTPIFLYTFVCSALPELHASLAAQLGLSAAIAVLFFLSNMWKQRDAAEGAFWCGLMLAVAGLFVPDALLCLPLLWVCFLIQRCFSLRTLLASCVGYCFTFFPWCCRLVLGLPERSVLSPALFQRQWLSPASQPYLYIAAAILLLTLLVCLFSRASHSGHDLNQVRSACLTLSFVALCALVGTLLVSPTLPSMLPLLVACIACLFSHRLINFPNQLSGWIFLAYLVLFLLLHCARWFHLLG